MTAAPLASLPARFHGPPIPLLESLGSIFAEFGEKTQDSGNISYGALIAGQRFFVKTAGIPEDPVPMLRHPQRVALLRNAVDLYRDCPHPALPTLHRVIESDHGPLLFLEWCDGDLVRAHLGGFRQCPTARILTVIDTVFSVHLALGERDWVAEDFYDGCLIHDAAAERTRIIDLDTYHRGPCINPGRRFGSSRFMAPEESLAGAMIDQRTTVFTLGRTLSVLLADGTLARAAFRGDDAQFAVMIRACQPLRDHRYPDIAALVTAWEATRSASSQTPMRR